jgi:hypothetical protein
MNSLLIDTKNGQKLQITHTNKDKKKKCEENNNELENYISSEKLTSVCSSFSFGLICWSHGDSHLSFSNWL